MRIHCEVVFVANISVEFLGQVKDDGCGHTCPKRFYMVWS